MYYHYDPALFGRLQISADSSHPEVAPCGQLFRHMYEVVSNPEVRFRPNYETFFRKAIECLGKNVTASELAHTKGLILLVKTVERTLRYCNGMHDPFQYVVTYANGNSEKAIHVIATLHQSMLEEQKLATVCALPLAHPILH